MKKKYTEKVDIYDELNVLEVSYKDRYKTVIAYNVRYKTVITYNVRYKTVITYNVRYKTVIAYNVRLNSVGAGKQSSDYKLKRTREI